MSEKDRTIEAVKREISPKVPCVNADADGYCRDGGFICCTCNAYRPVRAGGTTKDSGQRTEASDKGLKTTNKKATMKQPTYKMERIALADCKPHADAEAYSASTEDRAALSNSINESGLLSPIAVIPGERDQGSGIRDQGRGKKTWYVIDGIGRQGVEGRRQGRGGL